MKKFCKIQDGVVVQTQRSPEDGFIECPEHVSCAMVKEGDNYRNPDPIIKTQAELDAEKDELANQHASSPALEAAIEEFSSILTTASIPVPLDVKANITARIKGKL